MLLLCPVCREKLRCNKKSYKCGNGHCFDLSKDGYVNLLRSNKAGSLTGDNREMALCRKNVLSKGYYSVLSQALCSLIPRYKTGGCLLDICCGEGYYTSQLAQKLTDFELIGFDISKEMIRLAAKRKCRAKFFVANMTDIPLADQSADAAVHLFAPFCSGEFARVLKDDGVLFSVVSGENHLYEYKQVLYEKPYFNDEDPPSACGFTPVDKIRVKDTITLKSREDIMSLLKMTPYYYHTPTDGLNRLSALSSLTATVEFVIYVYRKG